MKTAISTQSQNEVKDLLNEYVVSPLNEDLSGTLSKMEREIESLAETTKAEIGKVSPTVNGNISRLQRLLDTSFHFDAEEDAFEKISDVIEDSQKRISGEITEGQKTQSDNFLRIDTVLAKLQSDLVATHENTNGMIRDSKTELLSDAYEHFEQLHELLINLETISKASTKAIKDDLTKQHSSLNNELKALFALVTESLEQSNKTVEDAHNALDSKLHSSEESLKTRYDELSKQLETTTQIISTAFDEQETNLSGYHDETNKTIQTIGSQQKEILEQKYKTLFTLSLSFGIANTIGMITMIVLYLLK